MFKFNLSQCALLISSLGLSSLSAHGILSLPYPPGNWMRFLFLFALLFQLQMASQSFLSENWTAVTADDFLNTRCLFKNFGNDSHKNESTCFKFLWGNLIFFLKKKSFLMVSLSCLVDIALVHSLYYEKQSYYCKFN